MRTNIYIDGFNLYYGALKGTPYKWLDPKKLVKNILNDNHEINRIKIFTARVSGKANNPSEPLRQNIYLRALESYIPEIEIHLGHFLFQEVSMPLAKPEQDKRFCRVIKTEEKGSDVNLAVHLLNDAWKNDYECGIIVSNDSDLAEAMRLVKKDLNKKIGLISPHEKVSKQLLIHADFQRGIRKSVLANSQLPLQIPGTNLQKPDIW